MEQIVYFDNNATTRVAPEVRDAMMPFLGELYGNPSSMHAFGGQIAKHLANAREEVAAFLNCSPEEIIFTSCATESDNAAIRGTAEYFGRDTKIITTAVEHPAVLQPCRRLTFGGGKRTAPLLGTAMETTWLCELENGERRSMQGFERRGRVTRTDIPLETEI